jgi:predicted transcriptional regulator
MESFQRIFVFGGESLAKLNENTEVHDNLLEYTAKIVASHVSNNPVPTAELTSLIDSIHGKLSDLSRRGLPETGQVPAVPIEDSVQEDFIFCLEDGKPFKMLKKHLMVHYGLSPAEYRTKWGLPADYPMVAPSYTAKRQRLALASGLGKNRS